MCPRDPQPNFAVSSCVVRAKKKKKGACFFGESCLAVA